MFIVLPKDPGGSGATRPRRAQAVPLLEALDLQVVDEFLHRMTVTIGNYAIYQAGGKANLKKHQLWSR